MGEMPVVSVIMSTCGKRKAEYLKAAVASVLGQKDVDFELVVCCDGPENVNFDYLRGLAEEDRRIRLIGNPESRGLAHALNLCIGIARGRYLARMDDDDVSDSDRLRIQADYLDGHPDVDYVGCNARLIDQKGVWGHRRMPEEPERKDFLRFLPYIHPAVMFRKDIFDRQEAYRTRTRRGEDYELFMRLSAAGCRGHNIQAELFSYREERDSYQRREWGSRLDEVRIRYHGFAALNLMLPWGWLYLLRPLAAGCVPAWLTYGAKRLYHRSRPGQAGQIGQIGMKRKMQRYRRALVKDQILYQASERLAHSVEGGTECRKTVAFYVMAPVMCMYVAWVLRKAREAGTRRLYFLARDGCSMYETARAICGRLRLPIECRYLYCSRYAWRSAEYHLLGRGSLSYICLGGIDVSFQKLMARAGLTESEGRQIAGLIGLEEDYDTPLTHRRIKELQKLLAGCGPFLDRMLEKSRGRYPHVAGYLRQEGLLDPVPWALVDSGWTGSMQRSLRHLLGSMGYEGRVEGYYFGMYEYPEGADGDAYHCWYFNPGNGLRRKAYFSNSLFECVFSSPEGMTVGYEKHDGSYHALLEKLLNPNWERIVGTGQYLKRYVEELSEASLEELLSGNAGEKAHRKIAFSLLKEFMTRPSSKEASEFGSYVFCDDIIGEGSQTVAAGLSPQQIRANRILHKGFCRLKRKGDAIRESAWLEGSIVRGGMGPGELWHCAFSKYILYLRKLMWNYLKQ